MLRSTHTYIHTNIHTRTHVYTQSTCSPSSSSSALPRAVPRPTTDLRGAAAPVVSAAVHSSTRASAPRGTSGAPIHPYEAPPHLAPSAPSPITTEHPRSRPTRRERRAARPLQCAISLRAHPPPPIHPPSPASRMQPQGAHGRPCSSHSHANARRRRESAHRRVVSSKRRRLAARTSEVLVRVEYTYAIHVLRCTACQETNSRRRTPSACQQKIA